MTKTKIWERPRTYAEIAEKRVRANNRKHNRELMKVKQAPFVPKTEQKSLIEEDSP